MRTRVLSYRSSPASLNPIEIVKRKGTAVEMPHIRDYDGDHTIMGADDFSVLKSAPLKLRKARAASRTFNSKRHEIGSVVPLPRCVKMKIMLYERGSPFKKLGRTNPSYSPFMMKSSLLPASLHFFKKRRRSSAKAFLERALASLTSEDERISDESFALSFVEAKSQESLDILLSGWVIDSRLRASSKRSC